MSKLSLRFGRRSVPSAALVFTVLLAGVAGAQSTRIAVQNVSGAEAARVLSEALGVTITVTGGAGKHVTLDLPPGEQGGAPRRLAAALGGTSRLKLRIMPGDQGPTPTLPDLERPITLTVTDVPAARVFRLLARELHAELVPAADLSRRITLQFTREPLRDALSRTGAAAGVRWSLAYEITAPDAPPPPPAPRPAPPAPQPTAPPPAPVPRAPALPSVPLARTLADELQQVVRSDPRARDEAVRRFVSRAEELLRPLSALSETERTERVRSLQPLLQSWRRLYDGLAPDAQRHVAPVTEVLNRYLR